MTIFILALLLCMAFVLLLRSCSTKIGLIDRPGGRKQHETPTPTVGGVAMFLAVVLALYFGDAYTDVIILLIGSAGLMVALGVLDDKHDLPVRLRMIIQIFMTLVVILGAEGTITHLGALFGGNDIQLGMLAIPLSVVAFVGGINAMNMIDGADGMAGKMALITTSGAAVIFYVSGATELLPLTWAMLGVLLGFLFFNSRLFTKRALVFMGDAGSMWIGLVLGWFMARVTHDEVGAEPALVLWLFGIPLLDTLVVMFRRMKRKRSPFHADRTHIHHLLEHNGTPVKQMVIILSLVQLMLVAVGVCFYLIQAPAWLVFWGFVALLIGYYFRFSDRKVWG